MHSRRNYAKSLYDTGVKIFQVLFVLVFTFSLLGVQPVKPVQAVSYAWEAYNDCIGTTSGNTTNFTPNPNPTTGYLIKFADGASTGVTVTWTKSATTLAGYPNNGNYPNSGTDAYATFYNKANMAGINNYGSAAGWYYDLTLSGLDPTKSYTFATTANRDDDSYVDANARVSQFTISDVDAATNSSTSGVTVVSNESVAFSTGYNTVNGYVARWTGIQAGSDGDLKVRTNAYPFDTARYGYGPSVFMLAEEVPTGPTITTTGTLSPFITQPGTPSDPQTYTVSGVNLEGDIIITPPVGFQIKKSGDGDWVSNPNTLVLDGSSGTVASTTIDVRLTGVEGTFEDEITHESTDATTKEVAVSGKASNEICVTSRISAGSDDVEQRMNTGSTNGDVDLDGDTTNKWLQMYRGYGMSTTDLNWWGLRFLNVNVPVGATITSADVTFRANVTSGTADSGMTLWGQLVANPPTFTATKNDVSSRTKTTSSASWVVPQWTSGLDYATPDLAAVVQEIVSQGDWAANNAIVIVGQTTVSQNRTALSYNSTNGATLAPLLEVCYTLSTDPIITTSGTLTPFTTTPGEASAEQSYTVSGRNLTSNLVISPPPGFQISTTSGSGFGSSVSLTPASGTVTATTIYVHLYSATTGTFGGNITHTSGTATQKNVAVEGTVSNQICYTDQEFVSTADTYLSGPSANQDQNYGARDYMRVTLSTNNPRSGLLRFNLASIPSTAIISSADLRVNVSTASAYTYYLYGMRQAWVEGTGTGQETGDGATWNTYDGTNAWGAKGAASTSTDRFDVNLWDAGTTTFASTGIKTVPFNAAGLNLVQDWVDGGITNNGLTIQNYGASTIDRDLQLSTNNNATTANRPRLVLDYCIGAENSAPNAPVLVSPTDNATGVALPPTLSVTVSDPDDDTMDVEFWGRPVSSGTSAEDFMMIAVPDTQNLAQSYPTTMSNQFQWIASRYTTPGAGEPDLVFVTHLGDIVNTSSSTPQWDNAVAAFAHLETANVPFSVSPGNHDIAIGSPILYSNYFGTARFTGKTWYQGDYESGNDNYNSYSFFSAGGMDFIVINLEYNAGSGALAWADAILEVNPTRRGIVVQHDILNIGDTYANSATYTALSDRPNLFLMLCGHMHFSTDGSAYRLETRTGMNPVHILLTDYQEYSGKDYIRLLTFKPADDEIYAQVFSPYAPGGYLTSETNYEEFTMSYDMVGTAATPFTLIGTDTDVASGGNASISWPDRLNDTEYEWYVVVSDGGLSTSTKSTPWSFTTAAKAAQTITVTTHAPASAVYNNSFTVAATASSGLTVTYSSGSPSVCSVSGATFTMLTGTGTCVVQYDQAGNDNFSAATQVTENVTAAKATQTITVTTHAPASAVYNNSFTVAATASSGLTVTYSSGSPSVCSVSGATFTMLTGTGTCVVQYDQAGNDNFSAATQVTENVTAVKATTSISTPPTASAITVGQTLAASTLSGGSASVPGSFAWTDPSITPALLDSGVTPYSVTFTPTDTGKYNTAATSITLIVTSAPLVTPIITTPPTASAITYGQTLANSILSGGAAQYNSSPVAGSFAWTNSSIAPAVSDSGTTDYSVTFTPTDTSTYNSVTVLVKITVNKATPTLTTAPSASAITYGQTLAASNLTGGAWSVLGSYAWTTPSIAPAVANSGVTPYSVTFTPTDTANYNTATTTITLVVNKATPTLTTAPSASAITYGQTLAASNLTGGVWSTAGTYDWTTPSTAPAVANSGVTPYSVTFTPTDTANYNTATTTVTLVVNKAATSITTPPTASAITVGQTLADSTLSGGVGSVAGSFAWTTPSIIPALNDSNSTPYSVTFTPTDSANYATATTTITVTVNEAPPCTTVNLVAAEDTYMSAYNDDYNYGSVNLLKVTNYYSSIPNRGALLKWDVSSIPSDSTISSASLKLYVSTAGAKVYNLYNMRRAWVEGTLTTGATSNTSANWNTYNGVDAWGTAGAANTTTDRYDLNMWDADATTFASTGSKMVNLNANGIAAIQGWITGTNYGVTIQNYATSGSNDDLQISSSENTTVTNRPTLNVTYCVSSTDPTISVTSSMTSFSAPVNEYSDVQSYNVTGANLTADIIVTAPANFEVSLTSGGDFASSVTLPSVGGTIYVRFKATAEGTTTANINHTSTGADPKTLSVSGTAYNVYTLTVTNDGNGSVTLNPTGGSYAAGTTVTLTPVPTTGFIFDNWSGANAGDIIETTGVYTIVMDENKSVMANFAVSLCSDLVFQEGLEGYAGTVDTYIMESEPTDPYGDEVHVEWDGQDPANSNPHLANYGLLRFDGIFGSGPNQIPLGSTIETATFTYVVSNTGESATVNDAAVDWDESVTYNAFGTSAGVQEADYGTLVGTASGSTPTGAKTLDVKDSLQRWSEGATNYGWLFRPDGTDGVEFHSSEYTTSADRPKLTVRYCLAPTEPTILVSSSMTAFSTPIGTASAAQTYTVSGVNLTNDIDISAPGGFKISTDGETYDSLLTLDQTDGSVSSTIIYVRMTGTDLGEFSGSIAHVSSPATPKNVPVTGTVYNEYTLTVDNDGNGTVTLNPATGPYRDGTTVTLTPVPDQGFIFDEWTGVNDSDVVNTAGVFTIVMNENKSLTATFTEAPPWTAYNDVSGTSTPANTTEYTIDQIDGMLKDFDTGAETGVTVTITQSGTLQNNTTSGSATAVDTDAYTIFNGKVNMQGVVQYNYNNAVDFWMDLTFEGLDPDKTYTFVTTANRAGGTSGDPLYTTRNTRYTISDIVSATNASSDGTSLFEGNPYAVYFTTGENTANGYIARWINIKPSAEGTFTVRAQPNDEVIKTYAFGAFMLQEEVSVTPDIEITGFVAIDDVPAGEAGSALSLAEVQDLLPESALATTAASGTVSVPVSAWVDTDEYDPSVPGSYTFTATLGTIPDGYANTGNYTATIEVVVTEEGDIEITGFEAITAIQAGEAGSALSLAEVLAMLPTSAMATTASGTVSVPVASWVDTDSYDPDVPGSYTFTATLGTIPVGYANTGNYTATIEVVVSVPPEGFNIFLPLIFK